LEDSSVGVLATDGSIANGVFQPLEKRFTLIYPTASVQESVMTTIYGTRGLKACSTDHAECRRLIDGVISHLQVRGAEVFLTGCTELEMFMARNHAHLELMLPMACLCECLCDLLESND
jgi:aspartate/glutamate racemase